jgi:hypothetical protein
VVLGSPGDATRFLAALARRLESGGARPGGGWSRP